jgi:hypothetical protein
LANKVPSLGGKQMASKKHKNYKKCKSLASKSNGLFDWYRNHRNSYNLAVENNWQRDIAKDLKWKILRITRTYDECKAIASSYQRLVEWKNGDDPSYRCAVRRKWQRQIAEDLQWKIRASYTGVQYEDCKAFASEYSSLHEWRREHSSSFAHAYSKNWQRSIALDLQWKIQGNLRSYVECRAIASNHRSLSEWKESDSASYRYAVNSQWQRNIAQDLKWKIYAMVRSQ